jgi:HEAT repeat protein
MIGGDMRGMRTMLAAVGMVTLGVGGLAAQQEQGGRVELRLALERARLATQMTAGRVGAATLALAEVEGNALRQALAARAMGPALGLRHSVRARVRTERSFSRSAPEPWLLQDPADSLYRAARESLNGRRWEEAARRFAELRERHPRSGYVGDAYYFQALALYRAGGSSRMDEARRLLEEQARTHPDAATVQDAEALLVRVQSARASRGDADAAADVARTASADCDEEDQTVRVTALSALLQMDEERAAPILLEVLRQRDECSTELRKQAVFLVAQKMSDETVDVLLDLAQRNPDPDPEVREAAIFWLSQVRSDEALDALLSILEAGDVDDDVREHVVFAISQHRSPRAAAVLRDLARDASASTDLRANAIFWLGQQDQTDGGAFLRELYASLDETELKERVLFSISQRRGTESRDWLLARARDSSEPLELRKNALFWAGQAGLEVQEVMDIYRASSDLEMKKQALFVLTQVRGGGAEAADALMEIARTEDDAELKQQAIFWLGQNRDPRVAEFLLELIRRGG